MRERCRRWGVHAALAGALALAACGGGGDGAQRAAERAVLRHVLSADVSPPGRLESIPDQRGYATPPYCLARGTLDVEPGALRPLAADLLDSLATDGLEVQSVESCLLPDAARTRTLDRTTGERRALVVLSDPRPEGSTTVRFRVEYFAGPMQAAGWECTVESEGGRWRVRECDITWVA